MVMHGPVRAKRSRALRRGVASIEVVATTAIGLTFGFGIVLVVRLASQKYLEIVTVLVGWPLL